jgi:hypothetical protein
MGICRRCRRPRRMAAMDRPHRFSHGRANGRSRRISPVAAHSGDGLLSDPALSLSGGNRSLCPEPALHDAASEWVGRVERGHSQSVSVRPISGRSFLRHPGLAQTEKPRRRSRATTRCTSVTRTAASRSAFTSNGELPPLARPGVCAHGVPGRHRVGWGQFGLDDRLLRYQVARCVRMIGFL